MKKELIKVTDKAEIKQSGMNPWKKVLKRPIFTDGIRYYIRFDSFISEIEINGRKYREVMKVKDTWFLI